MDNPTVFIGNNWTDEEKESICEIIEENDFMFFDSPIYNYWKFWKYDDGAIDCKRLTWDMGTLYGETLSAIIKKLKEYYYQ